MILRAFSLYDVKANYFSVPIFLGTRGEAIRAVVDLARDPRTTVSRHPADFQLYDLGEFDNSTGTFHQSPPAALGLVSSFVDGVRESPGPLFEEAAQ